MIQESIGELPINESLIKSHSRERINSIIQQYVPIQQHNIANSYVTYLNTDLSVTRADVECILTTNFYERYAQLHIILHIILEIFIWSPYAVLLYFTLTDSQPRQNALIIISVFIGLLYVYHIRQQYNGRKYLELCGEVRQLLRLIKAEEIILIKNLRGHKYVDVRLVLNMIKNDQNQCIEILDAKINTIHNDNL